jgi:hypothetical protein
MTPTTRPCPCCARGVPKTGSRQCPECDHVFQGSGWTGMDAHWKAHHEDVMPYEELLPAMCQDHRPRS